MQISISPEIKSKLPHVQLGIIQFVAENSQLDDSLWDKIKALQIKLQAEIEVPQISQLSSIQSGRKAYKVLGKDPARYRLSAESLASYFERSRVVSDQYDS